jgi:O-antigen/teichoic acid export membrane protein
MANTLGGMPSTKIGEIFTKIAFPAFSKIKDDKEQTKHVFILMHRYLFMVIAPMFVGIALTAEEFIPILLGEKWLAIVLPLQIICVANIFAGSALLIPRVFEGFGDAKSSFRYQVLVAILSPVALLIGSPWGFEAMIFAWGLSVPLSYFYLLHVLFKMLDLSFKEFLNSVSMTAFATILMVVAIQVVDTYAQIPSLELMLLAKFSVGTGAYFLAYILFGKKELMKFINTIRMKGE